VARRLKGLLVDAATFGTGRAAGQLLGFLLLPLYTRYLDPTDYGVLTMLGLLSMAVGALGGLGMAAAALRFVELRDPALRRAEVVGTAFGVALAGSGLLWALGTLSAPWVAQLLTGEASHAGLVRLSLSGGCLLAVASVPEALLRLARRVRALAGFNLLHLGVATGLTLPLVIYFKLGAEGVVWGTLAGSAAQAGAQLWAARGELSLQASRAAWRRLAPYALPLLPHRLTALGLALFGQYAVRQLLGLHQAGLYGVALRFVTPLSFVVNAIQTAWTPYKLTIHAEEADPASVLRDLVTWYVAGVSLLWLGVSVAGPEALRLLTAGDFHEAAPLVPWLALAPWLNGLYYMLGTGFEIGSDTKPLPFISAAGTLCVVLTSYLLIPTYGAAGAAGATALGWLVMLLLVYRFAQSRFPIRYDWRLVGGTLALCAGAGAGVLYVQTWAALPRLLAGGGAVLAAALGALRLADPAGEARRRALALLTRRLGARP